MFKNISYFEFIDAGNKYVSMFPSTKTTYSTPMPKLFDTVFNASLKDEDQFLHLLYAMKKNNFGFLDFFWFLPLPVNKVYSDSEIVIAIKSLYYEPLSRTPNYGVANIKSSLYKDFEKKVYIKDTSLPQEAIDTIPLFINTETNTQYVALGYKKKSDDISVLFRNATKITVLSVGIYGYVLYGEHLEPSEKAAMEDVEKTAVGKYPYQIKDKQVSPALRCLLEEGGFNLTSKDCKCYYLGKDFHEARDSRYWTFGDDVIFGYNRPSFSHTVCVVIEGNPPKELNEPKDTDECSKGILITKEEALKEFNVNGKYPPAFSSHVRQLRMCFPI